MNEDPPHQDWLDESDLDIDGAVGLPDPDLAFRKRLLERTTARIRHRRHTRLLAQAAALLIAFAAGAATTMIFDRTPRTESPVHFAAKSDPTTDSPALFTALPDEALVGTVELFMDPEAFTLRVAEAGHEERLRLLREGGDFYLIRQGDVRVATVCYERYLNGLGEDAGIGLQLTDTWLLRGLKTGLLEGSNDEENVG